MAASKRSQALAFQGHTSSKRIFFRGNFGLRYFGDAAARDRCAGCDNCLGVRLQPEGAEAASRTRKPRDRNAAVAGRKQKGKGKGIFRAAFGTDDVLVPATRTPRDELPALEGGDAELMLALKALRGSIAREEKVPAYVIFPDRTLAEMALQRPRTMPAVAGIRGVGPARLEKYGERFLAAIRDATDTEAA